LLRILEVVSAISKSVRLMPSIEPPDNFYRRKRLFIMRGGK
jgi:hypothetical protein